MLSALVVAVAITLVTAISAFADHSPSFYVEWDGDSTFTGYVDSFGNAGTGGPHQNYLEGTEKCGVCHAVHRALVPGVRWDTNLADLTAKTAVAGGQYFRAEFESDVMGNTQMLLMSSVANSCNYCHIDTAIGNKQIYAGNPAYISALDTNGTDKWDIGFGHGASCVSCHAVHGAADNDNNPVLYARYGTFEGPIRTKVLKVRVKNYEKLWQDEIYIAGSTGKVDAASLFGAGWADQLSVNDTLVDPLNVPLFPSTTDAIEGTNPRPDQSVADAQVSVFCTFCHPVYGWASEANVNRDGDSAPQSPWDGLADAPIASELDPVPGMSTIMFNLESSESTSPYYMHPMKSAEPTWAIVGSTTHVDGPIAFAGSNSCRRCHDAGLRNATGVIIQSWPHFTPGYYQFVKSAASIAATISLPPPIPDVISSEDTTLVAEVWAWLDDPLSYMNSPTIRDGQCIKCHVNGTEDAGVGITF
jgi:hypothetical protein